MISKGAHPLVSVVMPVRNESRFIHRSLGSVLAQDYPASRLEVWVVDGLSDDGTLEVVDRMASSHPESSIHVLPNPRVVVPEGINRALERIHGSVMVLVGGHCVIEPDYVRKCVAVLQETGASCVGGAMETVGETVRARAVAIAQSSRFGVGGVAFRTGRKSPGPVDTVVYGAYRMEVFDRVGTFDTELTRNQDDEFNYRLNRRGEVVWFDPSIRSTYYSRAGLAKLWRQYFGYGLFKVRVIQKTGLVSIRHLVPATFVAGLVAIALASAILRLPLIAVALALYLAAGLVAGMFRSSGRDPRALPWVPLAYAAIHLSYGLGFLAGLWKWRPLRTTRT